MILDKPLDTKARSRIMIALSPVNEHRLLLETAYEPEHLANAMSEFYASKEDDQITIWNNPVAPHPQEQFGFLKSKIFFYVISAPPSGLVIADSIPRKPMNVPSKGN